jgi:hypothetical protein
MYYRLAVAPDSLGEKLLKLLVEIMTSQSEMQELLIKLDHCLEAKQQSRCTIGSRATPNRQLLSRNLPEA